MPRGFLIIDANVLIDFCRTDMTLLSLVHRHVGLVHIASPVFAKVDQLNASDIDRLGLVLSDPEVPLAADAATRAQDSPLAFDDWVCLLMAQANGWTCVTNDKRLRHECGQVGVVVWWGLELLLHLARVKALTPEQAEEAAWAIHRTNARFVSKLVVQSLIKKLKEHEPKR